MRHEESKTLPCSCPQLFALVADIESYPQFMPGWSRVRILHSEGRRLEVEQQLRIGLLPVTFRSTAEFEPCKRITITSRDAPFGEMGIQWQFVPRDDARCEVTLIIELALRPGPWEPLLHQLMKQESGNLLEQFEKRARDRG